MAALTEIEKERARISETKRALDEQVQRKRDLLAQRDAQERAYYQQQEVRCHQLPYVDDTHALGACSSTYASTFAWGMQQYLCIHVQTCLHGACSSTVPYSYASKFAWWGCAGEHQGMGRERGRPEAREAGAGDEGARGALD